MIRGILFLENIVCLSPILSKAIPDVQSQHQELPSFPMVYQMLVRVLEGTTVQANKDNYKDKVYMEDWEEVQQEGLKTGIQQVRF